MMFHISRSHSLMSTACLVAATGFVAGHADANLLTNPGFEDAGLTAGDAFGAPGWTAFGSGTYTVHTSMLGEVGAHSGDHAFKQFGATSGIFQQVAVSAGDEVNAGAFLLNYSGDPLGGGQVAAVNIEWIQANGSSHSAITPFISNGETTAISPQDAWTLQTVTGIAPDDASFARLTLITGNFLEGGAGGAPFYDDAFLEVVPEPSSLALIALGGISMLQRRRRNR